MDLAAEVSTSLLQCWLSIISRLIFDNGTDFFTAFLNCFEVVSVSLFLIN